MSINQLIYRNLKKNLKNYYLYVFALIFSVALYFSFVTLQFDPSMDVTKGSIKGAAAIKSASVLLIAIVFIFILYANKIFIKRRSKEIGLFRLIGMTKTKIFQILSIENLILYFGSLLSGIFVGFAVSRLIKMILFKIIGVEIEATLQFSVQALSQTVIIFGIIYLFIMLMNYIFIKRQSILSLFRFTSLTESKVRTISVWEIIIGLVGILGILSGYYISSKLFDGDFTTITQLVAAMLFILASVIIGTYLFYKGSVRFIFNMIRKSKNGYLSIHEVLSLSSIMFRMKSNSLMLTIITTVSALAIGLLSLSYISYYSAEKSAENRIPAHFSLTNSDDAELFTQTLDEHKLSYTKTTHTVLQVKANIKSILDINIDGLYADPNEMVTSVISDQSIEGFDLSPKEMVFTGYNDTLQKIMPLKESGQIELKGTQNVIPQTYKGLRKDFLVSSYFTNNNPLAIVDVTVFNRLQQDINQEIQKGSSLYIGINLKDESKLKEANDLFQKTPFMSDTPHESRLETSNQQRESMGFLMFIVGFLGLTFLMTSGCILYFKQMDESEEEKSNYTILRKLGFTEGELLKGIQARQLFNFGIPLTVGLFHSYFAIQSGWFMFGTELWTPMIIVMLLYTFLYSIFGILSVLYYKKVIAEAL